MGQAVEGGDAKGGVGIFGQLQAFGQVTAVRVAPAFDFGEAGDEIGSTEGRQGVDAVALRLDTEAAGPVPGRRNAFAGDPPW